MRAHLGQPANRSSISACFLLATPNRISNTRPGSSNFEETIQENSFAFLRSYLLYVDDRFGIIPINSSYQTGYFRVRSLERNSSINADVAFRAAKERKSCILVFISMEDIETFWIINLEAFWINMIAGGIFFLLGLLVSIWLIPHFTIRLIRKRNKNYLKQKVSFAIEELCDFFSSMPHQFTPNQLARPIYSANLKYPKHNDFITWLKPDLFEEIALLAMSKNILEAIRNMNSKEKHELVENEIIRLEQLRNSLENIVGIHSNALEDDIINGVSQLCLDIRIVIRKHKRDDALFEELLNHKEGIFGASHLKTVYENAFGLLKRLVQQPGFSVGRSESF